MTEKSTIDWPWETNETCATCYFCIPNTGKTFGNFRVGTCFQAKRRVNAQMTACAIYEERKGNVAIKSTPEKRNTYKDKDNNLIPGYTLPEVLDKPLEILAKREYTWGKYSGMAVKIRSPKGMLAILEITADTPIKALTMPDMPKPPYSAKFVEVQSQSQLKYYTVRLLDDNGDVVSPGENGEPLPF